MHEVQNGLSLSSPSLAHYHIRKLVEEGLAREEAGGYIVDKIMFENMIRIRRSVIPFQTTYLTLFIATLFIMLVFFRPAALSGVYIFALLVNVLAIIIFRIFQVGFFLVAASRFSGQLNRNRSVLLF